GADANPPPIWARKNTGSGLENPAMSVVEALKAARAAGVELAVDGDHLALRYAALREITVNDGAPTTASPAAERMRRYRERRLRTPTVTHNGKRVTCHLPGLDSARSSCRLGSCRRYLHRIAGPLFRPPRQQ